MGLLESLICDAVKTTNLMSRISDTKKSSFQVKRLSNRITEASDGLSKGTDLLTLNCETTKDEVLFRKLSAAFFFPSILGVLL